MADIGIGFITNVLFDAGIRELSAVFDFAVEHGFDSITLGPTYPLRELEKTWKPRVRISDLQYCRNLLEPNDDTVRVYTRELSDRIETAGRLGIPVVTTSSGILERVDRRPEYDTYDAIRKAPIESIDAFERAYTPLVALAEKCSVTLAIENCPLMGNWAISPYLWEQMFERIPSKNLGLTFDPGHLVWQFMDPYRPVRRFAGRIAHVHAKDAEIFQDVLEERGILTDFSWFRFRIPGRGQLDWGRIFQELRNVGYDGCVSVEHEDPVSLGSLELVTEGLDYALQHLRSFASTRGTG